jgi:transposase
MSAYQPRMDSVAREQRRIEAAKRLRRGESAVAVAADLGVAVNSVYEWGKTARAGGLRSLRTRPGRGRPPKLAREHWKALTRAVLRGPRACGFERELWTLPMIREYVEREYGVAYHEAHLSRFMRRLGLTAQKPMVRARERDEKAIRRFIEREFPALEKRRGGAARR